MGGQMTHFGKAAQDGGWDVRGEHFSLRQDMPPSALGQVLRPVPEQLDYHEAMLYLREYEKKKIFFKACWSPQVPKMLLLKLLTGEHKKHRKDTWKESFSTRGHGWGQQWQTDRCIRTLGGRLFCCLRVQH